MGFHEPFQRRLINKELQLDELRHSVRLIIILFNEYLDVSNSTHVFTVQLCHINII